MKTIKNIKSIRVYTFTCVLMLMILLSTMIGTTAGKKPDRPGKPVETWDLKIWIGIKDTDGNPIEDIVLMAPEYLFAEDVPCSGGLWDFPSEKGNPNRRGWASGWFSLHQWQNEETGVWAGDDCGTYNLANVPNEIGELALDTFYDPDEDLTVDVSIQHEITPPGTIAELGENYWAFRLSWVVYPDPAPDSDPDPFVYKSYTLTAKTENGPDETGEFDDTTGWTVPFFEAAATLYSFEYHSNDPDKQNVLEWAGDVSFTVEISRTPYVPT